MNKKAFIVSLLLVVILLLHLSPLVKASSTSNTAGDSLAILGELHVYSDEVVPGDAVIILGKGIIEGPVKGNVVNILGEVTVNEEIRGDFISILGSSTLLENTFINGRLLNILSDINKQHGAHIKDGETRIIPRETINYSISGQWHLLGGPFSIFSPDFRARSLISWQGLHLSRALISWIFALLVIALFPKQVKKIREQIQTAPGMSTLWGFIGYLVSFPVILLFGITIIGIPIAILLGIALWAARFLGYVAIMMLIGNACLKLLDNSLHLKNFNLATITIISVAVGAIILSIATSFPFIGFFISIAVSMIALGGVVSLGSNLVKN